jgi:hypothetical protein
MNKPNNQDITEVADKVQAYYNASTKILAIYREGKVIFEEEMNCDDDWHSVAVDGVDYDINLFDTTENTEIHMNLTLTIYPLTEETPGEKVVDTSRYANINLELL